MNILILDDEQLIVDDLVNDVRTLYPDAKVTGTTNVESALEVPEGENYDIALLDIDMPEMNGLSIAKKLSESNPAVNIIFITGYSEYALEAHELYCSAFLVKPVGLRKLKKAFENLRRPLINVSDEFLEDHYTGGAAIGRKLISFREQLGISRTEMAERMGVTRQTVFRWERGDRIPDMLTFIKISNILGIRIEDIFSDF